MPENLKNPPTAEELGTGAEKTPDFAELQREKEKLFKEIEESSLNLDQIEKYKIVSLVLSHSVKDGFELARRLNLDPSLTFMSFGEGGVITKNKTFWKSFEKYLENNRRYLENQLDKDFVDSAIAKIKLAVEGNVSGDYAELKEREVQYGENIEDYYLNFLQNRRLTSPDLPEDSRTQAERTAEEHLASAEAILKESYYTGPIRKFLGITGEDDLKKNWEAGLNISENEFWYLQQDLISKDELIPILVLAHHDPAKEPKLTRIMREARYAPAKIIFEERKKTAEKSLVEQIKRSLVKRGYKEDDFEIKFNEEKEEYEVVPKDAENRERQKGNLKLKEEVPNKITYKNDNAFLAQVKIINGEVSRTYEGSKTWIAVDPFGNTLELGGFRSNSSMKDISGHEVIDVVNGYFFDGQLIVNDEVVSLHKKPVYLKGHLYWCAWKESGNLIMQDQEIFKPLGEKEASFISGNVGNLNIVDSELTYCYKNKNGRVVLVHGADNKFGPYEDIKICENSEDKLIFTYQEDGEFRLYDGENEKPVGWGEKFDSINRVFKADNWIFLEFVKDGRVELRTEAGGDFGLKKEFHSAFDEVEGRLVNIKRDRFSSFDPEKPEREVYWGQSNYQNIKLKLEKEFNSVAGINDSLFIEDGNKVYYLKWDENKARTLDWGNQKFEKIDFEGSVKFEKSGGMLFIVEDLPSGNKRVWQWAERLELEEREQKDLDLANAVAKEEIPEIEKYFKKYYPENLDSPSPLPEGRVRVGEGEGWERGDDRRSVGEKVKGRIKSAMEQSANFVGAVNQTIKDAPEMFLDTLRAKNDKPTEALMSEMFYYMFPEARERRERAIREEKENRWNPWSIFGGGSGEGGHGGSGESYDYDPGENHLASMSEADFYEAVNSKREVLHSREPFKEGDFVIHGIFGNWTGSGWSKVNVPISKEVSDPAKETTFEFVDEKAGANINLPKIVNSAIIKDRIKGIKENGEEMSIEILEENNLGEVRVKKGQDIKKIAYSQNVSEAPKTMAEITAEDYEKFRRDFEKSFGDVMTKEIGDLGDELDIFVRSLEDKTPREKVIAIQEFCYEYGYYNLDNQARDSSNFEERLSIMEFRMADLKAEKPELSSKKYAGICTDFASLTTALLRKAGFVSGIASGFVPEAGSSSVTTDRAHAVSYVLWPNPENKEGKPDLIIVDGTPSSITPKIVEQEKKARETAKELSADSEKKMAELEKILREMNVEDIKKLQNGQLEKTLNHILYGVKQSHVDVMNRVLNASRYAGFDVNKLSEGDLDNEVKFRNFLEGEIGAERGKTSANRDRRGEELFNLIMEFSERYKKDKTSGGKSENSFDILEKIFDLSEKYLDPIEKRSAIAIITYLRARKIMG